MKRVTNKLSARFVVTVTKKGKYGDGGGLYLVVTESGSKHWVFRYTQFGKSHEIGLGSIAVSLADVRRTAMEYRGALAKGQDPRAFRRVRNVPTFRELAEEFLDSKKSVWADSYIKKWRRQLNYIYSVRT